MLVIRLTRTGAKKKPTYRLVVIDKKKARDGRFVEIVGHYDPRSEPARISLKADRIQYWMKQGAQPSETVRTLLRRQKVA